MLEFIRAADRKGIDQVVIADHVVVSEGAPGKYPGESFPPLTYPWYEPTVILAAIAATTRNIRLATGILISPLRPAVLLAKQLATLDELSGGRLDIAFGAGWQEEEFAASGVPYRERFHRMYEQMAACRALWRDAPASFAGDTVSFEKMYCYPRPVQQPLPIWLGLRPTETGLRRMARFADGWARGFESDPKKLKSDIDAIKAMMPEFGRDPAAFKVRAQVPRLFGRDGKPDMAATFAQVPAFIESGADILEFYPGRICTHADQLDGFLDTILAIKGSS